MKKKMLALMCAGIVAFCIQSAFSADPGSDSATCTINVTVDSIIEWEGTNFAAINLTTINNQADAPEGSSSYTLWTNCNVELSADNDNDSRLTDGTDTLVTKYKISTDGDGDPASGASAAAITASGSDSWTIYNNFLTTPLAITHYNTDGNVEVTLYVQATNRTDDVSDSGNYTATQTITASWVSDD